mgnify:CR=1 FL=1
MAKHFLSMILIATLNSSFSQGTLRLSAWQNETCNLSNNVLIESINVKIVSNGNGTIKHFTFSDVNKNCLLTPGYYTLEIRNIDGNELRICDVHIRDYEFTFIDILFEPCTTLSRREIRKRKAYANYNKHECV